MENNGLSKNQAIAIVGMAGRFPGARNLTEFWHNLRQGVESVQTFSVEEIQSAGVDPGLINHPNYVRSGSFLEDADCFDAGFFGFTPREAEITDPQHRVFLETAWEALEDAGYDPGRYRGSIGVYAGVSMNTYIFSNLMKNPELIASMGGYQTMLGNDKDFLPTRVSYKLNLKGPSMSIQTACSTSLVAVQVACQALLGSQCDMALAGGVSVSFPQKAGYLYQEGMILSPDGHCRPFDAKGAGVFGGSGVGIVVLKRLEDALRDGDTIHAVIRGAAINNDGAVKVGYTAPSVDGQAEVIRAAQAMAQIDPETIRYVEAHGTGTPLGDPIEIAGLTKAFRTRTDKKQFCAIGSVKSNIGHLDAAAGVAGLIKTVLALRHRELPPSLNFETSNPQINFENSPFYVNTDLAEWAANGTPRRAAVSSFGIGGTNAHVVLEEAPAQTRDVSFRQSQLIVLSARTVPELDAVTRNLCAYLKAHPEMSFADVAYTLQIGRKAFNQRRMVLCQGRDQAIEALERMDTTQVLTAEQQSIARGIVFMFSGQGSQHVNMASQLYGNEPSFREHVDRCAEFLIPHTGIDLRDLIYPGSVECQRDGEDSAQEISLLDQTRYTQTALFVIEYALARLWMSWGIEPECMIGHSIGEYVAACLAGVFSLEDALMLVASRGRLMQDQPSGAMLAVFLPEAEAERFLTPELSLASINSPSLCTIAGPQAAIQKLNAKLTASGVECRRVHTSHAFHSWMMDPVLDTFTALVRRVELKPPSIPFVSNVTGTWIKASEATDPAYWARHLRNPVRFADGLQEIVRDKSRVLLEVGPGQTLVTFAKQSAGRPAGSEVFATLPHVMDRNSDAAFMHTTLGRLWLSGANVNWDGVHAGERCHRVGLPTYPFERKRFWPESKQAVTGVFPKEKALTKNGKIAEWFYIPVWKQAELSPPVRSVEGSKSCALVFVDQCGLGEQVLKQLSRQGRSCVAVRAGDCFGALADGSYTVVPQERQHYDLLLQDLITGDRLPDRILHLWNLTPGVDNEITDESVAKAQNLGFLSLTYLVQAIGDVQIQGRLDIAVVSNYTQRVTGDEKLSPEKTPILGPCKVIPQEYSSIRTRSIDIVLSNGGSTSAPEVANRLLSEFPFDEQSSVLAYRGMNRWSQSYQRLPLAEPAQANPRLREKGVYLITGGLGGIGLVIAEYLAQSVQARLILTGRTDMPPQTEWSNWIQTHPSDDSTSRKITKIMDLEKAGADVMVVRANVADASEMQAMLSRTLERFGEIHGVIHAAGLPGGGMIQMRSNEQTNQVLSPKIQGTLVLERLFRDRELDFIVLCSSINAIYGGLGSVDYCAANIFQDAFANSSVAKGDRLTVSINWDPWQEVGMAANAVVPLDMVEARKASLRNGILPVEGVEALRRVLATGRSQIVVSTQDLLQVSEMISQLTVADIDQSRGMRRKPHSGTSGQNPAPSKAVGVIRCEEERVLLEIWQELLGVEAINVTDDFFELGGHSLLATRILARIQEAFKVRVPLRVFFENPTVRALAREVQTLVWVRQGADIVPMVTIEKREEIEL